MKAVSTKIILDKRHQTTDKKYVVKLRIIWNRKTKYYPITLAHKSVKLTDDEFNKILGLGKKSTKEKNISVELYNIESRATECIKSLRVFTFELFEKLFIENSGATENILTGFTNYAKELEKNEQISTATNYITAKNSLLKFTNNRGLKYIDVSKQFLKEYERYLINNGKSRNTISIYMRSLRTIFNKAIKDNLIDRALYPFGKGEYEIPASTPNKRAITKDDIKQLLNYEAQDATEKMAVDFWLFSYLCNGMNITDILQLKRSNVKNDIITFIREKTKRSNSNATPINTYLREEVVRIMEKYGTENENTYIFPILNELMNAKEKRKAIQAFTKFINRRLKEIGKQLGLPIKITTYTARHSFATVLRNANIPVPVIGTSMGHSSSKVTDGYFGPNDEEICKHISNQLL